MIAESLVGPQLLADGAIGRQRSGRAGEVIASELHGRFYEQVLRGNVFSIGCKPTALSAATFVGDATCQPILGVWNPPTSPVNLVMLQAALVTFINNVTSVAPGGFVWGAVTGVNLLTAGLAPFNRKTMGNTGSQAKAFSLSTASLLTGLLATTPLLVFEAAEFNVASGLLTTTVSAATPTPSVNGVQYFDGSLFVPPGGVLALLNTISVTTHSVSGRLLWEEVPI